MEELLIEFLDNEIEKHKDEENASSTSWDRGYANGAMTEALIIKSKIRALLFSQEHPDNRILASVRGLN